LSLTDRLGQALAEVGDLSLEDLQILLAAESPEKGEHGENGVI
jgi:hypothetical protein